ncbi:circularly permuted type 2 ATP-grasp protein [Rhodococcus sp. CX]|uniref:circularly permuted type 2 ATP-grasp protein n=1 Tax=Rhodococcus sp. CX TaxID=2789880 RepID=UPI0018CF9E9F|nr:circularly permuted type 2 ATP-grasp protein [Rhodococcus sp. CX]MBH0119062.1 circularly permuted type 2 ATP-grasp protein [Rhodococcus sp. CX]
MTDVADVALTGYVHRGPEFDELLGPDGRLRAHWADFADGCRPRGPEPLAMYRQRLRTLVDHHGISYNPIDPSGTPTSVRWNVDGVPLVLAADDWAELERGLVQRSRLLDALLADLYGELRTVRDGLLPPRLVFGHAGYVRAAHGLTLPGPHQLFLHAVDVARGTDGRFRVSRDLTQAPSGAGYAMVDRRVMSRALPDLYQTTSPRPLSPFAQAVRLALRDVAPVGVEDPTVVVLTPGATSETAFDQAYIAGTLGLPLVESADLVVRDGRLWMRSLGSLTRVDVVLRRVDAAFADPLDLRPDSHLGVVGLVEVVRRGAVSVVNTLGSGVLENPALAAYLPWLCRALLDEELLLESAPAHWGGTDDGRSLLTARFDDLVLRSAVTTETVVPGALDAAQRELLRDRVFADPARWVGTEPTEHSYAPVLAAGRDAFEAAPVGLRLFTVAQRVGFTPMPGGLGQVLAPGAGRDIVAKDVWVRSVPAASTADPSGTAETLPEFAVPAVDVVTSPRVLGDLFWIGRYSERAEDTARLLIAVRERYQDYRFRPWLAGSECLPVLLQTLTAAAPSSEFAVTDDPDAPRIDSYRVATAEFRSLTVDADRLGSLAQSFAGLERAARAVRDQLSNDTWSVLADVRRALDELATTPDEGGSLLEVTQSAALRGMLALSGLGAESMVRDIGWHVMDIGKRIERGLALTSLLSTTLVEVRAPGTERALVESVLVAAESSVTFRRRNHRVRVAAVAQLLLFDIGNPRSLAHLLDRIKENLRALPDASGASRPERLAEELITRLRRVDPVDLEAATDGTRTELAELLTAVHRGLEELSELLLQGPLSLPGGTRPLWGGAENRRMP